MPTRKRVVSLIVSAALEQVFTRLLWTARTAKRRDNRRLGIRLTRRSHAASAL